MSKPKPKRARTHELEDESYTKFRAARPSAWPVHKIDGSDDYGRDLLVEVFENHQPTGNEFSVQLKAREKLIGPPKVKLKLTTLNHWADQPSPTLIVLWDAATDELYYEWAHRLPWSNPKSDKKTRTVPVPHKWTDQTPAILAEEADAFRKVRDLGRHFPVDVEVKGSEYFGDDAGPAVAAIIDALEPFTEFEVTFRKPRVPYVRVQVLPNGVEVSMSGTPVRTITYGAFSPPPPEVIASDVLFALSFTVGAIGRSRDVGTALLAASVRRSYMAIVAGRLTDAIVILAQADSRESLMVLLERTLGAESHPNWQEAMLGMELTKRRMSPELRLAIASMLEKSAQTWKRPAPALRTAAWLIGPLDVDRASDLWDTAVSADPSTKQRAQYWSERGGIAFLSERWDEAVSSYREAVRLGDKDSRPLLADALMWAGKYVDSLREFEASEAPFNDDDSAEWRLKILALHILIDDLGFKQQRRDDFVAERLWAESDKEKSDSTIREVLEVDALFGWAHWAKCPPLNKQGRSSLAPLIVASVCLPAFPPVLQELVTAALGEGLWEISRDALLLARRTCGREFIRMAYKDSFIKKDLRTLLLDLWGVLDDEDAFYELLKERAARQQDAASTDRAEASS